MNKYVSILLAVAVTIGVNFCCWGDEELYTYGNVKSREGDTITVEAYDLEKDETMDLIFEVNSETKIDPESDINKIKPGDDIDVYYIAKEGKNTATSIILYQYEDEKMEDGSPAPLE